MGVRQVVNAAIGGSKWQAVLLAFACLAPASHEAVAEPQLPGFQKFRFNEDYSFLQYSDIAPDWYGDIKYVPLGLSGRAHASIGGSVRQRYENTGNPSFGGDPQDQSGVWLQRVNLHANVVGGPHWRFFGELQSAIAQGREGGPSPVDEDQLALLNGFADYNWSFSEAAEATLRVGRQEIELGSGRLVDVREGTNLRRTFDGFRAFIDTPNDTISLIAARPRLERPGIFDDPTDYNEALWGLYAVGPAPFDTLGRANRYYLGYHNDFGSFVQGVAPETRHSLGMRAFGESEGWDWNWEALYQFGTFGAGDISAWTVASITGFTFRDRPLKPRVSLRANVASGDKNENDPNLETFNPLFPRGNYFSQAAVLGPRNFFNINPHLNLRLAENLYLNTDVNFFWRLETTDGVYSPSGQIIRRPDGSNERYVATGVSVELAWSYSRSLDFTAIYTHLAPGTFIEETGPSEPINFVELTARLQF